MKKKLFRFTGANETELPAVLYLPPDPPVALVQVTHGMTEHIGRYDALAEEFASKRIALAGFDLRGHGQNPGDPDCASFGEGGWKKSLEDMHRFTLTLSEQFPGIPHFMLGFSLGSFLLREYLNRFSFPLAGAAILGTGQQPGAVLALIKAIVNGQIRKGGFDSSTPLVDKLSFGTYNQKFAPNRTAADWLCADSNELDAYLSDPLCRKTISSGLFSQLLGAMQRTGGKSAYAHWNRKMPVLLLSGQDDPVGDAGKGVLAVKKAMEKAGIANLSVQLFPGARHDLLHEEAGGSAAKARTVLSEWILANLPTNE